MGILLLIVLVIIPGASGGDWRVTFKDQCALKGTSVVMECEFDYPRGHITTSVTWLRVHYYYDGNKRLSPLLLEDRFTYVGNYRGDCNLEISNVQQDDAGAYTFKFATTLGSYLSTSVALLSVKELTAIVQPSTVTEGDTVTLTCVTGCRTPTPPTIYWYRDGVPGQRSVFQAVRRDAGRYHCALRGRTNARSASVTLNVQYPPERVTVRVSPSADIVAGNSVTFSCSSDANPSVAAGGYSIYKDRVFISTGQSHIIPAVQPGHSGLYHCQAQNGVSRIGVSSISSAGIHLNVQYSPVNVSINVTSLVEGSSVNLSCSSSANPAADEYTWYRSSAPQGHMDLVGWGEVLSFPFPSHTGFYLCKARNRLGEGNSSEVLLAVPVKEHGTLPVVAGVGVSLLVTLVLALLLFWRKRRTMAKKKTARALDGDLASPADEDQSSRLYINMSSLPSRPAHAPDNDYEDPESCVSAITYSTVDFKPRNSRRPPRKSSSGDIHGSQSSSVIYSTVAEATGI